MVCRNAYCLYKLFEQFPATENASYARKYHAAGASCDFYMKISFRLTLLGLFLPQYT